jgi:carbamoyl-phosphate synthase small subunit
LIGLACGAKTYKLKFGHRGGNHPVLDLEKNKVAITSQNHGYAIDQESLKNTDLVETHIALNDRTNEGLKHKFILVSPFNTIPKQVQARKTRIIFLMISSL